MTDAAFNAELESFASIIQHTIHSKHKSYCTTMLTVASGTQTNFHSLLDTPDTVEHRIQWMTAFGAELRKCHPDIEACFLAAEAWLAEYPKGAVHSASYVPPSQHAARKEVITIMGRTRDGRNNSADIPVRRSFWRKRLLLGTPEFALFSQDGPAVENGLLAAFFAGYEHSPG